jgi:hypothetical protein
MKAYRGSRGIAPLIPSLGTRWNSAVYSPGKNPITYRKWGWVGCRIGLGGFEKEKNLLPLPGFEPRFFGYPYRISHYTDWAIVAKLAIPRHRCSLLFVRCYHLTSTASLYSQTHSNSFYIHTLCEQKSLVVPTLTSNSTRHYVLRTSQTCHHRLATQICLHLMREAMLVLRSVEHARY